MVGSFSSPYLWKKWRWWMRTTTTTDGGRIKSNSGGKWSSDKNTTGESWAEAWALQDSRSRSTNSGLLSCNSSLEYFIELVKKYSVQTRDSKIKF